jgi:hypothetical protein
MDMLQIVSLLILVSIYLKLARYNVIVHKTSNNIIVSLQCRSIFSCVILHQNLFLQAKQCYNTAVFPMGVQF